MTKSYWLIFTAIHILFWMLIYRFRSRRKTDVFDPFYMVSLLYMLIFVFGPSVWLDRGQSYYQGVQVIAYLKEATIVFNIGYLAYALGSIGLTRRKSLGTKPVSEDYLNFLQQEQTRTYITRFGWVLFLGSMALSLIYYRLIGRSLWFMLTLGQGDELDTIRSGYGIYFLMQFVRSAIPGLLILIAFAKKWRPLIYVCAYILCAVCISTGSRNLAICVVLAIAVYSYMKKGKRPSLFTVGLAFVILYLFVGLMGIFRGAIKIGSEIDMSTVTSEGMFDAFMFNVEIFYPFYTLVGYIKRGFMSIHNGLGVINIVLQFIPRIIWPGKPATLGKTSFEAMYGDSMGGAAYPNIGEFYYEFGLIGAILLMWLFGVLIHRIYLRCRDSRDPLVLILFAMTFGYMMQFVCRGHFASWAIDIVFMFGPVLLLRWTLKKRYNQYLLLQQKETS